MCIRDRNLFVKTGFEYFIDPTQSLGVSATLSDGIRNNENKTYTLDNGPGDKKYWRYTNGDGDRSGYDVNLNYDKKFTNPKQKLTSYLRFSDGLNDGLNEYYNNDDGGANYVYDDRAKNGQDGTSKSYNFKLDYTHPFENDSKLEFGLNSKSTDRGDKQIAELFDETTKQYVADRAFTNEFEYNETVHAAYIQYGGALGFIGYNVGGRYETVDMMSELKNTNE